MKCEEYLVEAFIEGVDDCREVGVEGVNDVTQGVEYLRGQRGL